MSNFYCQRMCGDTNFSIDEWNSVERSIRHLPQKQQDNILFPETLGQCNKQCFDCMAIVGERQLKTKTL